MTTFFIAIVIGIVIFAVYKIFNEFTTPIEGSEGTMETDSLKNIEKYLYEILKYMRFSMVLLIVSLLFALISIANIWNAYTRLIPD